MTNKKYRKTQNPLRTFASTKFNVDAGSGNLVANNIYSVEDIVFPVLTETGISGDPRSYVSGPGRSSTVKIKRKNRGWLSPPDNDDLDTVVQYRFSQPKTFNRIAFDISFMPLEWSVWYFDDQRSRMVKATDINGESIEGSFDANSFTGLTENTKVSWRHFFYELARTTSNIIEIHLKRIVVGGERYSIGVNNFRVTLRIRSEDDVTDDGSFITTPIGTTERPVVIRYPSSNAHDDNDSTYWESSPQGAASSVVPFYLDIRDLTGDGIVLDTLQVIPITPGPYMKLYWSNDDLTTTWALSNNRTDLVSAGATPPVFTPDIGISVTENNSSWTLPNSLMRADTSKSFQIGLHFTPTVVDSADHYLWSWENDSQTLAFMFHATSNVPDTSMTGTFQIVQNGSTSLYTSNPYTLLIDTPYGIIFGHNHDDRDAGYPQGWYLGTSVIPATDATIIIESGRGIAAEDLFPTLLRIGNNDAMDKPMNGIITDLWGRLDSFSNLIAITYLKRPTTFLRGDGDKGNRVNGYYNGIFSAELLDDLSVRIGPDSGYFRSKTWKPVPKEFSLSSTKYEIDPIKTKFLKMEFTNLIPRVYLTKENTLPVTDYPHWVRDWFRSVINPDQGVPYTLSTTRSMFEAVPDPLTPGDPRQLASVRQNLEQSTGADLSSTIFHGDNSTLDSIVDTQTPDGVVRFHELAFATVPMYFFRESRHSYDTHLIPCKKKAYFVGIKEIKIFRSNKSLLMDNPEYRDNYDDNAFIENLDTWINVGGSYQATSVDGQLVSKTFVSYSNFKTVQMAVLDNGWESMMTPEQINLQDIRHLRDPGLTAFSSSTTTTKSDVTGQYQGARGGSVIQLIRKTGGTAAYGVRTNIDIFTTDNPISGDNPRTSAAVRLQFPKTNVGTYELRLYAKNGGNTTIAASKIIKAPIKVWKEFEIAYVARTGDSDWQVAVVQTDPLVSEPFVVDMIGIWQDPVKWEISNDDGSTWQTLLWSLNKPNGYIHFGVTGHELKIRTTALRANVIVSGWLVVPWYIESSLVVRAPIDYYPPWGTSDSDDLRDTAHKPMFMTWNHYFPQRYSIDLVGQPLP